MCLRSSFALQSWISSTWLIQVSTVSASRRAGSNRAQSVGRQCCGDNRGWSLRAIQVALAGTLLSRYESLCVFRGRYSIRISSSCQHRRTTPRVGVMPSLPMRIMCTSRPPEHAV
ncbi:hypothetical protein OH76DRAFT_32512 [Lentinus brumalis]|uniref:Secreted protein n=1 Tax=Lentinus brumalis TaxID=2498619 RepID=A0A371DXS6_9APHY|nr:hypothetical protein OH76DRAFT_32512 [Polyporus brumalis]